MAEGFGAILVSFLVAVFLLPVGVFLFFCVLGFLAGRMTVINTSIFSKIWPVLVSAFIAGGICLMAFRLLVGL